MRIYRAGDANPEEHAVALAGTLRSELTLMFEATEYWKQQQAGSLSAKPLPRNALDYVRETDLRKHLGEKILLEMGKFFCMAHATSSFGTPTIDHSFEHHLMKDKFLKLLNFLNSKNNVAFKDLFLKQEKIDLFFKPGEGGLIELTRHVNLLAYTATENLWYLCGFCNTGRNSIKNTPKWFRTLPAFGDQFVTEKNLEEDLHSGVIINRIFKRNPDGLFLEIDGDIVELRTEDAIGLGKCAVDWFFENRGHHLEVSKEFNSGIESLVYHDLLGILKDFQNDSVDLKSIDMRYRRIMKTLKDLQEIFAAISAAENKLSDSYSDNSDSLEMEQLSLRTNLECTLKLRKQDWWSKMVIHFMREQLGDSQSKEMWGKIFSAVKKLPFPRMIESDRWNLFFNEMKGLLLQSELSTVDGFLQREVAKKVDIFVNSFQAIGESVLGNPREARRKIRKSISRTAQKVQIREGGILGGGRGDGSESSIDSPQSADDEDKLKPGGEKEKAEAAEEGIFSLESCSEDAREQPLVASTASAKKKATKNRSHHTFFQKRKPTTQDNIRYAQLVTLWDASNDAGLQEALKRSRESFKKEKAFETFKSAVSKAGLELHDVPHDGNCFFHAVVEQLKIRTIDGLFSDLSEEEITHDTLRELAVGGLVMLAHRGELESYFVQSGVGSMNDAIGEYISGHSRSTEWATSLVISTLARVLGITIVLINSDGNKPTVIHGGNNGVIYLGYQVGVHFQSTTGAPSPELREQVSVVMSAELDASHAVLMQEAYSYGRIMREPASGEKSTSSDRAGADEGKTGTAP